MKLTICPRRARFGAQQDGLERPSASLEKAEGALDGFNQWLLNGEAFSMEAMKPGFYGA
jgi:hypothetical protein